MTATDKAYELIHKHHDKIADVDVIWINVLSKWLLAKQCALIAVDEIMNCIPSVANDVNKETQSAFYWQEVKKAIEKL